MSIKESMLNIVSDLAQNDYIRAVTYGGYSRRVEVSELAKSVVEDYTGSSLAGENQSVQGAFSALETEIQNVEQDVTAEINDAILNILPTDTASGEIASFPDGSDLSPALSVVAGIEPVQDLHGYDAPWVGGAGKNKYPIEIGDETLTNNNSATHSGSNGVLTVNFAGATASGVYASTQSQLCGLINGQANSMYISFDVVANGSYSIAFGTSSYKTETVSTTKKRVFYEVTANNTTDFKLYQAVNQPAFTITVSNFMVSTSSDITFAPYSNICPISGHDEVGVSVVGKNLLNLDRTVGTPVPADGSNNTSPRVMDTEHYYVGLRHDNYYYPNNIAEYSVANNEVTVRGTNNAYGVGFPIEVKPNTQYKVSATVEGSGYLGISFYDAQWHYISFVNDTSAFTTPSNASYAVILLRSLSTSATATWKNVQVELGTTATDYEPYTGRDYTIDLGQTVYGAALTYTYADGAASWAMTVEYGYKVFDGSESWLLNPSYPHNFGVQLPNTIKWDDVTGVRANGVSDKYVCQYYTSAQRPNCVLSLYAGVFYGVTSDKWCVIRDDRFNTVDEFKTWLASNNVQLAYELATPTTIQLTETQVVELFKGYNNVFSDAGDMSVTYKADIQLYIDKQTNELRVAILALS